MAKSQIKALWGIDPFNSVKNSKTKVLDFLKQLNKTTHVTVDALYFMSAESLGVFPSMNPKETSIVAEKAQAQLNKLDDQNSDLDFRHLKIIKAASKSSKSDPDRLSAQAVKNKNDFIVVASHGRSGAPRLFMGSFAESLLLTSKVPVVIINPKANVKKVRKILFASDLSASSKKAFGPLTKLAKETGAQVTVFHKLFDPAEAMAQTGVYMAGGGFVSLESNLKKERQKQSDRIKKFGASLSNKGIKVKHKIVQHSGPVDDLIVQYAKNHNYDMIVMGTESGRVATFLFGSIARQVARSSDVPTMLVPIK